MVERGNELHCPRLLHGIAEHVARHVADTDGGERGITDVEVHFAEVALHRFPGAAGGNAHFFMVVTGRTAGGESVVEPEPVLARDCVGDVGEGRGAFIGGDDEIGIVVIVAHDILGWNDLVLAEIVGNVE